MIIEFTEHHDSRALNDVLSALNWLKEAAMLPRSEGAVLASISRMKTSVDLACIIKLLKEQNELNDARLLQLSHIQNLPALRRFSEICGIRVVLDGYLQNPNFTRLLDHPNCNEFYDFLEWLAVVGMRHESLCDFDKALTLADEDFDLFMIMAKCANVMLEAYRVQSDLDRLLDLSRDDLVNFIAPNAAVLAPWEGSIQKFLFTFPWLLPYLNKLDDTMKPFIAAVVIWYEVTNDVLYIPAILEAVLKHKVQICTESVFYKWLFDMPKLFLELAQFNPDCLMALSQLWESDRKQALTQLKQLKRINDGGLPLESMETMQWELASHEQKCAWVTDNLELLAKFGLPSTYNLMGRILGGEIFMFIQEYEQAIACFAQVPSDSPLHAEALLGMASNELMLRDSGQNTKALEIHYQMYQSQDYDANRFFQCIQKDKHRGVLRTVDEQMRVAFKQ